MAGPLSDADRQAFAGWVRDEIRHSLAMTEPLSGARFQREVGADPDKWAAAFLAAYAKADGVRTDADRLAFVAHWFRDFGEAAVKAARDE